MKKLLKVVLFIAAVSCLCVSCGGDDEDSKFAASSLTNSVLSGNIESFTASNANIMAAFLLRYNDTIPLFNVGYGEISSAGKFSFSLATPADSNLTAIESQGYVGTISDPTALVSEVPLQFIAYNGEEFAGGLIKSNFSSIQGSILKGAAYSIFMYSNKAVTVTGNQTGSYIDSESQVSINAIKNNNYSLIKGWNEIVCKLTRLDITSNSISAEVSLSNAITNDLKWRLWSEDALNSLRSSDKASSASFQKLSAPLLFSPKKIIPAFHQFKK